MMTYARRRFTKQLLSQICQRKLTLCRCNLIIQQDIGSNQDHRRLSHDNKAPVVPLYQKAMNHLEKIAIIDQNSEYQYSELLHHGQNLSKKLSNLINTPTDPFRSIQKDDQNNPRFLDRTEEVNSDSNPSRNHPKIAFLCDNDVSYVVVLYGVSMMGGVAVPLGQPNQRDDLHYRISNAQCSCVIYTEKFKDRIRPVADELGIPHVCLDRNEYVENCKPCLPILTKDIKKIEIDSRNLGNDSSYDNQPALMVYTSGTTANPKGVLLSHRNLQTNMEGMVMAWRWTSSDVILHVLPLYHIHGIVNVLMTSLYCGATCVMLPAFDARETWMWLTGQQTHHQTTRVNMFMAVPTIYNKLLQYAAGGHSNMPSDVKTNLTHIRLMVSGSDALPVATLNSWVDLTGHFLLERYGMTEVGMALTNDINIVTKPPDQTQKDKISGAVGNPFPGVSVRITQHDEDAAEETHHHGNPLVMCEGTSDGTTIQRSLNCDKGEVTGELWVKGENVFMEYWNNPEATAKEFSADGWFKTGDFATYTGSCYKILGRTSVDIIKSGGYKISALQIERVLSTHPNIQEVAVIGKPDPEWGQRIAAVVVPHIDITLTLDDIRKFCGDKLPKYQIPSVLEISSGLPRNNMGKVSKKVLIQLLSTHQK